MSRLTKLRLVQAFVYIAGGWALSDTVWHFFLICCVLIALHLSSWAEGYLRGEEDGTFYGTRSIGYGRKV